MPRPRYPSDENRRAVRPHAKVHVTVATHRKTAAAWADLESRAILVELWRLATEAYASRTEDEVVLSPANLRACAGRSEHRHNLRAIRALCARVGYELRVDGALVIVKVRNFAKKQGFANADSCGAPRTTHASYSDSDSDPKNPPDTLRASVPPEPQTAPEKPAKKRARTVAPEALSDSARADLREWAEESQSWAVRKLPELEAACLDHFRASGELKADWIATVRNWVRKAPTFTGTAGARAAQASLLEPPRPRIGPAPSTVTEAERAELARRREVHRRELIAKKPPARGIGGEIQDALDGARGRQVES